MGSIPNSYGLSPNRRPLIFALIVYDIPRRSIWYLMIIHKAPLHLDADYGADNQ
jgi:hypothetical protein